MTIQPRPLRQARGANASVFKYDILTALGSAACAGTKHDQRLTVRLMTLITARYDWQQDKLMTGQTEIARLWSVDPRTVKREMAQLRERGWLHLKAPAAKGRVACYGLGIDAILRDTRPHWDAVGTDFVARMDPTPEPEPQVSNVIRFSPTEPAPDWWQPICAAFQSGDAAGYGAWIAPLTARDMDGTPALVAPTGFHATYVRTHYWTELDRLARRFGIAGLVLRGPAEG